MREEVRGGKQRYTEHSRGTDPFGEGGRTRFWVGAAQGTSPQGAPQWWGWERVVMAALQVETAQEFAWQSQLRHRWDEGQRHCYANICDAQLQYAYEYLGNTPRLVITPLTDR